jgi:ParB family chromosome partitioning protein
MSAKARKLGRGLDALIRRSVDAESDAGPEIQEIDPKTIAVNRAQPRQQFDPERIAELAQSIQNHGILQPIVVHVRPSGDYELVAGERRLRAALSLNLPTIPVIVRAVEEGRLLDLALIENIQRENLNPIELATAYRTLKERHQWTQAELAAHLGKKRSTVANTLRYLDLPEPIQQSLSERQISEGHVKILLALGEEATQLEMLREILESQLTVRELEARVAEQRGDDGRKSRNTADRRPKSTAAPDPQVLEQEELLSTRLGTKVEIKGGSKGRGRIVIEYYSHDDYDRLRKHLTRP